MNSSGSYILLDGARLEHQLHRARELNGAHLSLYKGSADEFLEDVGPFLFADSQETQFREWYKENGWNNAWGILVDTNATFEECCKHFRKFLLVKTEDDQELYFRFYDPRVLKIFLPTCDEKQIIEFFGPVEKFIVEGETKEEAIEFSHRNGVLQQKKINATEVFGNMETMNV